MRFLVTGGAGFLGAALSNRLARDGHQVRVIDDLSAGDPARLDERVLTAVRHFASAGKPIASICHGQQVLAAAGVLEGKTCTAYPAVRPDLERAGATWAEVNDTFSNAVVDGNLVTAPAWPAHPQWMRKFLQLLGSAIQP